MKILFMLIISALGLNSLQAQPADTIPASPCQQIDVITNRQQGKIITDFVSNSLSDNYFINNKGIISLRRYRDANGDSVWILRPLIDNRYEDNPPTKFSTFGGDIILVYDADERGNEDQNPSAKLYNACLEDVIGNRVYPRPTRKDRWINETIFNGRKMNQGIQRGRTGNGGSVKVVFKKDGSYEISRPV
ncbi:MAG: hypothetical protein M3421_12725 [Bacteroidota bacterium]|nr:hypothetical protein [Bacteroidota bacterium]